MSTQPTPTPRGESGEVRRSAAEEGIRGVGSAWFVAILLMIAGTLNFLYGIAAVANSSFYGAGSAKGSQGWVRRVTENPKFRFTAKLWQKFTHDPSATKEDERAVRAGLDVLRKAEKLGAVLLQFPFSFHCTRETTSYLTAVLARFADYPLVVESQLFGQCEADKFCEIEKQQIKEHVVPLAGDVQPGRSPLLDHCARPRLTVRERPGISTGCSASDGFFRCSATPRQSPLRQFLV